MKKKWFLIISLVCCWLSVDAMAQTVNAGNALRSYLQRNEPAYAWEVKDSLRQGDVCIYRVKLTSQVWQQIPWVHELDVVIPNRVLHSEALLHITGGSIAPEASEPNYKNWDERMTQVMVRIASETHAIAAVVRQVPRQPLYDGRYEDEIISLTFHRFLKEGNYELPLLFPMVKSAVKAMDAVEELAASRVGLKKGKMKFVLNGASKRGWTTWLCGASGDKRIVALAPMVIDILNMPVNVPYQASLYGGYSEEINDYVNLGLTGAISSGEGRALVEMVDPYSYRRLLKMPKMIFMGTNDPYWTADAVKNYIDDIPGHNQLVYVPNAAHNLGDGVMAMDALEAFFIQTLQGKKYVAFDCQARQMGRSVELSVRTTPRRVVKVRVWEATSATRDFRKSVFEEREVGVPSDGRLKTSVQFPEEGYKAFYVMAEYLEPLMGRSYRVCSRMFTAGPQEWYDQPYCP